MTRALFYATLLLGREFHLENVDPREHFQHTQHFPAACVCVFEHPLDQASKPKPIYTSLAEHKADKNDTKLMQVAAVVSYQYSDDGVGSKSELPAFFLHASRRTLN